MKPEFLPYSIVAVDIQRYSDRSPVGQLKLREELRGLVQEAARQVGIDLTAWERQDSGDGELALVPPSVPKVQLADDLVRELGVALRYLNVNHTAVEARLRLRVAMHHGEVHVDGTGYVGSSVVETSRLLDAEPLRETLEAVPDANLAVILSEQMLNDVDGQGSVYRHNFQVAQVDVKRFHAWAWITAPGFPPPYVAAEPGADGDDGAGGEEADHPGPPDASTAIHFSRSPVHGSTVVGRDQRAGRDLHNR